MTGKGISEAQKITGDKMEAVRHFLKSLDSLSPRIKNLHRYLLKQWLKACENKANFAWDVRNQSTILPLPQGIIESISKLRDDLVERGLAVYASLHHNTSGPSSQMLVTSPEIRDWLNGTGRSWLPEHALAPGVRTAVLDEYLSYLLNGLSLVHAKRSMLHSFTAHNSKLPTASLRWLSQEYGVPVESLWSWLEELESCGDFVRLNQGAKNAVLTGEVLSLEDDIAAYGSPWDSFADHFSDDVRIENEVKNKVEKWFETGEEVFQHFELRRIR
jgi:hypothetical protein